MISNLFSGPNPKSLGVAGGRLSKPAKCPGLHWLWPSEKFQCGVFKRKAANGCSVNHLCQQTDPIMSANPGNTGGKFKSSSMKHLINILNVFLAIYASRAMGCFGVPLIFQWRSAWEQGQGGGTLCRTLEGGGVGEGLISKSAAWPGVSLPLYSLHPFHPAGTPQPFLFHLLLTA